MNITLSALFNSVRWTLPLSRLKDGASLVRSIGSTLAALAVLLLATATPAGAADVVWVEDATPPGASLSGTWSWISANPAPYSGSVAHRSTIATGTHQHYFHNASPSARLSVNAGDTLFAYVYLDPANPPSQVMLQWNDGNWEHRAYWGANSIGWGVNGTNSRRYMGALPPLGQWVRLEVPASLVGLEGRVLNGMAFTLYNGRATWDRAGKLHVAANLWPTVQLNAPVNNSTYTAPAAITLTATATDSDGSIAGVAFYSGTTLIGTGTLAGGSYTHTWNNVPAGSYSLTARATDNQGATADSAPVAVTVTDPVPPPVGAGVYYIYADHLDTPRVITDTTNKIVWRWDSGPFGADAANEDPDGDGQKFSYNLRFPGQYYDKETGLHYNYFRDYEPGTGRYVQSDPIGLQGGMNVYSYANQNPLTFTDPLGLMPFGAAAGSGLGAGSTLGAGGAIGNGAANTSASKGPVFTSNSRERNTCENCDERTLRDIAERKKRWCKIPNQPRACLISDNLSELFRKRYHLEQCIRARDDENMCKGTDPGHQKAVDDFDFAREFCDVVILSKARSGMTQ